MKNEWNRISGSTTSPNTKLPLGSISSHRQWEQHELHALAPFMFLACSVIARRNKSLDEQQLMFTLGGLNAELKAIIDFMVSFSSMHHWVRCAIVWGLGVGFVFGFPSLDCPAASSSRWCEIHSNQQKWPPMVPSSPSADGWTIGKFALPTTKGLQGTNAICGQDVGGTQW